jgi:hypothetical protein
METNVKQRLLKATPSASHFLGRLTRYGRGALGPP